MKEMKNSANNNDNLVPMLIPLNSWSFRRLPEFLIPVSRTCWISAPGIQLISRKLLGYWTRHGRSRKRWLQLRRAGGNLGSDATPLVATRLLDHFGKTFFGKKIRRCGKPGKPYPNQARFTLFRCNQLWRSHQIGKNLTTNTWALGMIQKSLHWNEQTCAVISLTGVFRRFHSSKFWRDV